MRLHFWLLRSSTIGSEQRGNTELEVQESNQMQERWEIDSELGITRIHVKRYLNPMDRAWGREAINTEVVRMSV